jgi:diacylglycerol kinase family enzyme
MRVHLVANPTAGRGRVADRVRILGARLEDAGARVTTHWTARAGDARAHVATLAPDACDRLVVVGGDGTLHEVVNARPTPLPWPVAIVPVGTANLVARDVGMPLARGVEEVARAVLGGAERKVDLLETDRGLAVANVGAGLDAEIVRAAARARHGGAGGYARWVGPIASTFVAHVAPAIEVSVDGAPALVGAAVMLQNTRSYGGMFTLCPDARMDDGLLHAFVVRRGRPRDWFRMILAAYRGVLDRSRDVTVLSGRTAEVSSRPRAAVQLDGDPAGETPVRVSILPGALTLVGGAPPRPAGSP